MGTLGGTYFRAFIEPLNNFKVHAALLTVGLIYGANYSIAKSLMPDFIGPNGFILLRIGGAFIFFFLAQKFWIKETIKDRKDYLRLGVCALFGVAANMLCFFNGLALTSPINASVIMTINPVLVLLFSIIIAKETVGIYRVLGIALGMTGAILQILDPFGLSKEMAGVNWRGDLFILFNAASYAIYLVLVKPLMAKYHPLTVVKWTFIFGLVMVLPFGFTELVEAPWQSITPSIALKLGFVVIATTFIAYLLNAWTLRYVSSSVVGSYIYLQPVLAAFIAVFISGYQFHLSMLVYAGMIFGGVYLVSFVKTKSVSNNG